MNGADRYDVWNGSMPRATAVVSAIILNVEPGCRRALVTKLNWLPRRPGVTAVIALIAPVRGSIETIADDGSVGRSSTCVIAAFAARCSEGLIVVYTLSPPSRTVFDPYSCCS